MNEILRQDRVRYGTKGKMPAFQKYYRLCQSSVTPSGKAPKTFPHILKAFYGMVFKILKKINCVDISPTCNIGGGLYGHPYVITINPQTVIGRNCNIHKGVTIGQENRGERKGTPTIGDMVWIGVNATIVGKITIGNDVLIAPNSYVNVNVPSHSVVLGNPCVIIPKENATRDYINNLYDFSD